ncbi:MAG TPA: hypothetical protein VN282_24745 [Pyrinomonadaceae bacterium]|nr:hypothetical protein [Pyrinomonadaceae bacterium]
MLNEMSESKALRGLPRKLRDYLQQLEDDERALLELMIQRALHEPRELEVIDLWENQDIAVTFWILLITGVNQEEEMELAKTLLSWRAFFPKRAARALCVQSSERSEFRCCSSTFGVVNCPVLIFSDSPDMQSFVKVEPELLFKLAGQKGDLQRFLTKIHALIENGDSLSGVQSMLLTEKFWAALKIVYGEVKGFISFSAKKEL